MKQKFGPSAAWLGLAVALASSACGARNGLDFGGFGDGSAGTGSAGLGGAAGAVGVGGASGSAGFAGKGGEGASDFCADCFNMDLGPCEEVTCDGPKRLCMVGSLPNGEGCDDEDFCTVDDACIDGVCQGEANTCGLSPSPMGCQTVTCDPFTESCSLASVVDGMACMQSDPCQVGTCQAGSCAAAPKDCSATPLPNEDCYVAGCDALTGECTALPSSGTPCTIPDDLCALNTTCQDGVCGGGTSKDCSDLDDVCTVGVCVPETGDCSAEPAPDGTACDDGDPCTSPDSCSGGSCGPGAEVLTCSDGDQCCPEDCDKGDDSDCPEYEIVLEAVNRGWWNSLGDHSSVNDNTLTGYYSPGNVPTEYNSYFSFDLSSVSGLVVSATLLLELETFYGSDSSETLSVWDVSTPAATLEATGDDTSIFDDLQNGNSYGSYTAVPSEDGSILTIPLDAQAIADINAALGSAFSVGVHIDSLAKIEYLEALRFSAYNEARVHELVLGVQ